MGQSSPTVTARNEPLPEHQMHQESNDASDGATTSEEGHRPPEGGFDVDVNIEGLSNWAKDFARDFRRNFSSLATPPEPEQPADPPAPTPSPAPTSPMTPPQEASGNATPEQGEPWTWSSASGATSPTPPPSAPTETEHTGAEPEAEDAPPTSDDGKPPATDIERLRVLEALERGDIDIDEALTKLDPDSAPRS